MFKLSQSLRAVRKFYEFSEDSFCRSFGLSRKQLSLYERGLAEIPHRLVFDLCNFLAIDIHEFSEGRMSISNGQTSEGFLIPPRYTKNAKSTVRTTYPALKVLRQLLAFKCQNHIEDLDKEFHFFITDILKVDTDLFSIPDYPISRVLIQDVFKFYDELAPTEVILSAIHGATSAWSNPNFHDPKVRERLNLDRIEFLNYLFDNMSVYEKNLIYTAEGDEKEIIVRAKPSESYVDLKRFAFDVEMIDYYIINSMKHLVGVKDSVASGSDGRYEFQFKI